MTRNIVTSVALDVDSSSMDSAEDKTKGVTDGLSNMQKTAIAGGAAIAGIVGSVAAVKQAIDAVVLSALDFENTMSDAVRGELIPAALDLQKSMAGVDEQIAKSTASITRMGAAAMNTGAAEYLARIPEAFEWLLAEHTDYNIKVQEMTKDQQKALSIIQQEFANQFNLQQLAGSRTEREILEADAKFETDLLWARAQFAGEVEKERLEIQIKSINLARDRAIEANEEVIEETAAADAQAEQERQQAIMDGLTARNLALQEGEEKILSQHAINVASYQRMLDEQLISQAQFDENVRLSVAERDAAINEETLRAHEANVNAMTTATNSLLRYADKEIANMFRAVNDLIKVLQQFKLLSGSGGVFGLFGGGGGGEGGGGGSAAHSSASSSGLTMGNTFISVSGGNTNTETAAVLDTQLRRTMQSVADKQIQRANLPGGSNFAGIQY